MSGFAIVRAHAHCLIDRVFSISAVFAFFDSWRLGERCFHDKPEKQAVFGPLRLRADAFYKRPSLEKRRWGFR